MLEEVTALITSPPELANCLGTEDFAPGLEKAFNLRPTEGDYYIEDISGEVPRFLRGFYYLNGPAIFSRAGLRYQHWLDGDGMVCRLRFSDEGVHFVNRFVRTRKFVIEEQVGHPVFRTFGTSFPGDALKRGLSLESPGNVSVFPFHGKLLAFGEQALPWELDQNTLDTIGACDFGGTLNEVSPFAAHPKFDFHSGEMFNFGVFFSAGQSKLCLYRGDQAGNLTRIGNHPMPYPSPIHDFGLTREHLVFYVSPYLLDIEAMLRGKQSLMDSLHWRPELGSRLLVFARSSGERLASVSLPGRYCLHLINCFDDGQRLTVDVIELERPVYDQYQPVPELFRTVGPGGPVRLIVDVKKQELISQYEMRYRRAPDFPTIVPESAAQPYRDFWMLGLSKAGQGGRKFFDELIHARWDESEPSDIFRIRPGCYLAGEPVFAGTPAGVEGVVICQSFDAERCESAFLVFNAADVSAGPVATLRLRNSIHLGFHATFSPMPRHLG